ncbi:MAG: hypothetical protein ACAI35_00675 [Candidatus Methylacidiphilales bacterium]|nr:hypothetical protein [Candidatus Methylacidiphilales bacterium]
MDSISDRISHILAKVPPLPLVFLFILMTVASIAHVVDFRGPQFTGVVLGTDGKPVKDAVVIVFEDKAKMREREKRAQMISRMFLSAISAHEEKVVEPEPTDSGPTAITSRTARDGSFSIPTPEQSNAMIVVYSPGKGYRVLSGQPTDREGKIQLQSWGSLIGL